MFTLIRRRTILVLSAALMVLSISLFPLSSQASAKTIQEMNVSEASSTVGYYYALRTCVRRAIAPSNFTQDTLNKQGYFGDERVILGAQFISGDGDWDGFENCNSSKDKTPGEDGGWVRDAISALGYSDSRDFLCHVMNASDTTAYNNCRNGQGDLSTYSFASKSQDEREAAYSQSVGKKVFGNTEPLNRPEGDAIMQNILYNSFYAFCQPTDYKGGSVGSDLKQMAVKQYQAGPPATYTDKQVLVKTSRLNMNTGIIEANPAGMHRELSCNEMPGNISIFADKAAGKLKNIPATFFTNANTGAGANQTGSDSEDKTSCTIDGIGWILCPVMNFMGGVIDGAYSVISAMLATSPSMFDTTKPEGKAAFSAWEIMRNLANIAFAIVFLIIIFSQLTSFGVSNYGIKKMLPKLIVAAILVNISFYICAIGVDLSNILGSSLKGAMDNLAGIVQVDYGSNGWDDAISGNGKNTFTAITGGLIATAGITVAILYAGLSVLLPILIAALAAIVTVVVVLTLRQALVVLLIVVAPLAFVALLLPNTEGLFKKWRSLLTTLLLMYPIIALIFGASALAGKIVMGSSSNMLVQIMGAGVTIIPLFITPVVMRAAGGVLNRFAGMVNNPNKGVFDRMRKGADNLRGDRQNLRNARALSGASQFGRGAVVRWGSRRKAISSGREAEMNRANTGYVAQQAESNSAFRNAVAGGTNLNPASVTASERALASSINTQYKLETDEVNASKVVIEHANLSGAERQELAMKGSVEKNGQVYSGATMQRAALQEQLKTGSMGQINEIIANSGSTLAQFSQTISQGVASNGIGAKNPAFGGKTIDDIAQGKIKSQEDVDNTILNAIKEGKFTAESMASMHDLSRTRAMEAAYASSDRSYEQLLKQAAKGIKDTPELANKISGNAKATQQIEELVNLP